MSGFCPKLSDIGHLAVGALALVLSAGCLVAGAGDDDQPPYVAEGAEAPCQLSTASYLISGVQLPFSNAEADVVGFNLDADEQGRPDNAAGTLYATLDGQSDTARVDLPAALERSFRDGELLWVVQVGTCADAQGRDGYAQVTATRAQDVDNDGVVELVAGGRVPATGYSLDGVILAHNGTGEAPVSALVDVAGSGAGEWGRAHALAVELQVQEDGTAAGRIGFGVPNDDIALVAAPLAAFFTTWLAAGVSDFAAAADVDNDGVVTAGELRATRLYRAMFAPDVDLYAAHDGQDVLWPRRDGTKDHLSFAAGYTATPVEVE